MKRAVVLGMARSGRAAAAMLERRGVEVVAAESGDPVSFDGVDALVKSPGVPREEPLVVEARERGVDVWGEVELAWRLLPPHRLVAVTGTKGKTTTTALLARMLDAPAVGNIGRPYCDLDGELEEGSLVVCELSSFQLEDVVSLRPRVAVLLNLEQDHLDRHGSVEAYRAAKLRIFENQRPPEDWAITPRAFGPVPGQARIVEFGPADPLPAEPRIPGAHNRGNAVAATMAARAAGARTEAIADALRSFEGVPHRLELVREIGGVRWVNDSIATNTLAVTHAIAAFDAPLRLIVGGRAKGETWDALAATAARGGVVKAYLVGEAGPEIGRALTAAGVEVEEAVTLDRAVAAAARDARAGDVVVLSPACASYDQYSDFEERGDEFRRLVGALPGG